MVLKPSLSLSLPPALHFSVILRQGYGERSWKNGRHLIPSIEGEVQRKSVKKYSGHLFSSMVATRFLLSWIQELSSSSLLLGTGFLFILFVIVFAFIFANKRHRRLEEIPLLSQPSRENKRKTLRKRTEERRQDEEEQADGDK